jgi:hypothetical protein
MTLYDDSIEGKSIADCCAAVRWCDKDEKMMNVMNSIITHVKENNLQWLVICDQHSALYLPRTI